MAVQEVLGPIERIDDPGVDGPGESGLEIGGAFFSQNVVPGVPLPDDGEGGALGLEVGTTDEVPNPFTSAPSMATRPAHRRCTSAASSAASRAVASSPAGVEEDMSEPGRWGWGTDAQGGETRSST